MTDRIRYELEGHVAKVTLARAEKRNAFDLAMLRQLAEAYTRADDDDHVRAILLCAEGAHFTAGLDLAEVGPAVASGWALFPADPVSGGSALVDPLGLRGRVRKKPVVACVRGYCLTIGIELALASDVVVAADDTRFGQIEIKRGIFPFGGATMRLPARAGWGNAMRWLLTGDLFDAAEALRIGVAQEVTPPEAAPLRAMEIATAIARAAPLGVQATLTSARLAHLDGEVAAAAALLEQARALMGSADAAEGMRSFVERRDAVFTGR